MFKFKSIKTKQMTMIGLAILIFFTGTLAFVTTKSSLLIEDKAFEEAEQMAQYHGMYVRAEMEVAMDNARTLAQTFEGMKKTGKADREVINSILKNILEKNQDFKGVWAVFEPNALDGKDIEFINTLGSNEKGQFAPYWNRETGSINVDPADFEDEEYYLMSKKTQEEIITNPTVYDVDGKDVWMMDMAVPIMYNGEFVGAVGVTYALDTFQKEISKIRFLEIGYAALISNNGTYVAHKDDTHIGKDIGDTKERMEAKKDIKEGKSHDMILTSNSTNEQVYRYFTPIHIGKTKTPWSFCVSIPMNKILEKADHVRNLSILIGFVGIIAILIIMYLIINNMVRPINKTINMLKDIAEGEGDLTKRLDVYSNDEIGELAKWFNLFVDKIQELVSQAKYNADVLAESSSQIALGMDQANKGIEEIGSGIGDVSDSSQNNASVVEEATASIEELASSSEIVSQEAKNAFESGAVILKAANQGAENIKQVVEANNRVKESTKEVYEVIGELKASSDQVGAIVSIITNISEQTNLLALNAAIEAARAGEHGRGFAVVAEEVRKLAEESKTSASEISSLISEIQTRADNANKAVKEGQQLVEVSVDKSNVVNEHFKNILESIEGITRKIEMISNSSIQQVQVAEEMTKAMDEISATTQDNASSVQQINEVIESQASSFEEIGASVEELKNVAFALKDKTDKFKVE
ncbi:methyl-accepting chemotaxis protein [Lutibacter sp. B2]|nr:methyl-accepting chemotaxis protein [Lutibacter sp. B2]